jgi:hypothetical protein
MLTFVNHDCLQVQLKAETMFYHEFKLAAAAGRITHSNPYSFNFLYSVATPIFNK